MNELEIKSEIVKVQKEIAGLQGKLTQLHNKLDSINLHPENYVDKYYKDQYAYYFISGVSNLYFTVYKIDCYEDSYSIRKQLESIKYLIDDISTGCEEITKEEFMEEYDKIADDLKSRIS